jgi:hypothetical protein
MDGLGRGLNLDFAGDNGMVLGLVGRENNKTGNRTRQNGLNNRLGEETSEFYVCVCVCGRLFHTYATDRAASMRWFF